MKVKIGVREYDIVKQNELVEVGGELYGKICYKASEITIATKFDQLRQNATFLHELIHGVCEMQNLTSINEDEHYVDLLATGLHRAIVDNPHIFQMKDV